MPFQHAFPSLSTFGRLDDGSVLSVKRMSLLLNFAPDLGGLPKVVDQEGTTTLFRATLETVRSALRRGGCGSDNREGFGSGHEGSDVDIDDLRGDGVVPARCVLSCM